MGQREKHAGPSWILYFGSFLLLCALVLSIVAIILSAQARDSAWSTTNAMKLSDSKFYMPAHATKISKSAYYLGSTWSNGKHVQGYLFVHEQMPDTYSNSTGPTISHTVQCWAPLAQGIKIRTPGMPYVLNSNNVRGLTDSFVNSALSSAMQTWDCETTFQIFGSRDTTSVVNGIDTNAPDGKNEIMFGSLPWTGLCFFCL